MIYLRKKTIEDYVELVYNLQKKNERVHTNDIANALGINPASVTEIFQKLHNEGYIDYEKYSGVKLTDKGKKIAVKTKNKHEALKEFLLYLGLNEDIAEQDACEMEHILHPETMDMIVKFVEVIRKCEVTPVWLQRFHNYVETDKLSDCPEDLVKVCLKYSKKNKK